MTQNTEGKFRKAMNDQHPSYMVIKLQVNPAANCRTPFDFICQGVKHIAVECKETKSDVFKLTEVKPHQVEGLLEWEATGKDSYSYILVRFEQYENVFFIPISEYILVRDKWPKLSMHRLDMLIEFKNHLLIKDKQTSFILNNTLFY